MYTELALALIALPLIASPVFIGLGFLVLKIKGE
jgi:hypothetical protein